MITLPWAKNVTCRNCGFLSQDNLNFPEQAAEVVPFMRRTGKLPGITPFCYLNAYDLPAEYTDVLGEYAYGDEIPGDAAFRFVMAKKRKCAQFTPYRPSHRPDQHEILKVEADRESVRDRKEERRTWRIVAAAMISPLLAATLAIVASKCWGI